MTLLDLTEPLLQYVCRLNRLARRSGTATRGDTAFFTKGSTLPRGVSLEYPVVRAEVLALLDEFNQKAKGDIRLASQAQKMELPLLFFIDSMISESSLSFAAQWNQNRLAYDRHELAGDEKFFDLIEETLKDPGDEASERLALFYVCIGLGFTGVYFRQPEYLRKTMLTIAPRIRLLMEADHSARICAESYQGIDTRNLVQPPGSRLTLIAIIFLCFTLAAIATYFYSYRGAKTDILRTLDQVLTNRLSAAPGVPSK